MQKIIIKNFGPIDDVEIDVSQILVLIGEQASGKSTIAKLIYFFKSLKREFLTSINEYNTNKSQDDFKKLFAKHIKSKFFLLFGSVVGSVDDMPQFAIKYIYADNNYISIQKRNENIFVDFSSAFTDDIAAKKEILKKYIDEKNEEEKSKYSTRIFNFIKNLFADNRKLLYVPAGRNITVTYSKHFQHLFFSKLSDLYQENHTALYSGDMHLMKEYFIETQALIDAFQNADFEKLIEKKKSIDEDFKTDNIVIANELIEKILKGKYTNDTSGEKIYIDIEKNKYVQLNNAASGQQEIIRILQDLFLIILEKKNVFRAIEEPEAHLYPSAQKNIIELISLVTNITDSQIIITTHSPYILSAFNNLLYADKIANLDNSKIKEIETIIPTLCRLNKNKFRAYSLKNKVISYLDDEIPNFQSIVDNQTGLISQNFLDDVSEDLTADFEQLYAIHNEILKS